MIVLLLILGFIVTFIVYACCVAASRADDAMERSLYMNFNIVLDPGAFPLERAHDTDAGLDIMTPVTLYLKPHESVCVDTGVHVQLPPNTVGFLKSKSGLNVKFGITSEGVIDEGYTGSIQVKLYNNSDRPHTFERGDKITQLVILPVLYAKPHIVSKLADSDRGNNGFGSTGR